MAASSASTTTQRPSRPAKTSPLNNGGVINNNTYVVNVNGTISGTGGLTKSGTSALYLNVANTYSGGLTISDGSTVGVGTAGALGNGANTTTVGNGSTLLLSAITIGTTVPTTSIAATRTINLTTATSKISVANNTYNSWTVLGTVTGAGALNKTGTGLLTLSGPTSYTGGTNVTAGNLYINTDQTGTATGAATVASGAQLAGNGKIGATSVGVGGTISAGTSGNAVAALVANGDVTLTDGTTAGIYKYDFAADGNTSDSFIVGGAFNITGGALTLTNLAAANGASYVLASAGSLGGTFASVNGLVGGYTLGYTGTQIVLNRGNTALYFTGTQGADLGTASNFSTDAAGTSTTPQTPTAAADVTFADSANPVAASLAATISANTFVDSLTFSTTNAVSISSTTATNTLSIKASGLNNAVGTGIVLTPTSGGATINSPVAALASQNWTNNSANALTVNGTVALGANTVTLAGSGPVAVTGVVSGTGGLTMSGTGTATLTGANTYTGVTTVSGGTLRANSAAYATILNAANTTGGAVLTAGRLVFDYTGTTSPVAQVKSLLDAGYAGGFAAGQIRASGLAANRTLGYGDDGASAVTVLVTLPGDANLDSKVDFNDFLLLQQNFGQTNTRFDQGNFNYDGATDFNDFLLLQQNFGQSADGEAVSFTKAQVAALTAFGLAAEGVPEPTSLAVLGLGAAGLLRRRRA